MDWLGYYGQLREYKDNLEQRFQALLFQEGLVAVASVTIVLTLDDKLETIFPGLPVAGVAALVILVYSSLTSKYFRQVREVALMMAHIEKKRLGLTKEDGIKLRLTSDPEVSIFAIGRMPFLCRAYSICLAIIVITIAIAYPLLLGPSSRH